MQPLKLFLLLFIMSTATALNAQAPDTVRISVAANYQLDHEGKLAMHIRWIPTNLYTWYLGNQVGYRVRRMMRLDRSGRELTPQEMHSSHKVIHDHLLPLPQNEWLPLIDQSPMAGVVQAAMYSPLEPDPNNTNYTTITQKHQEALDMYSYALFACDQEFFVAEGAALGFRDYEVDAEATYLYIVELYETPNEKILGQFGANSAKATLTDLVRPVFITPIIGDRDVLLQWERQEGHFGSFKLERSTNPNDGPWEPINSAPIVLLSENLEQATAVTYRDSLPENGTRYHYRVSGKTPFGVFSQPSDPIEVIGKPGPKTLAIRIDSTWEKDPPGSIKIGWSLYIGEIGDVSSFSLFKSPILDGQYTLLKGPMSATEFTYTDGSPGPAMYYYIEATDVNGYRHASIPVLGQISDVTPPAMPTILSGTCDEKGNVLLRWTKNHEPDFMGCRVYMAHGDQASFVQVTETPVADSFYRTTVSMEILNEEVWYVIEAFDIRQNRSGRTAPFLINKPDVHPPAAPIITTYTVRSNGLEFFWELSPSTDVVRHTLQRSIVGTNQWEDVVFCLKKYPIYSYLDLTANKRKQYIYRLEAKDDAGLRTFSRYIETKPYDDGLRAAITNVVSQYAPDVPAVYLRWDYPKDDQLQGFQVFRSVQDSTTRRSYAYLTYPDVRNPHPGYYYDLSASGAGLEVSFADLDVDFAKLQINTFVKSPAQPGSYQVNQSLPPSAHTSSQYTVGNANNMTTKNAGNKPATLYYWIMADYKDGGYSPIYGPIVINL
jgi:uncharacterized protein